MAYPAEAPLFFPFRFLVGGGDLPFFFLVAGDEHSLSLGVRSLLSLGDVGGFFFFFLRGRVWFLRMADVPFFFFLLSPGGKPGD